MNDSATVFGRSSGQTAADDILHCEVSDAALEAAAMACSAGRGHVFSQRADREHSGRVLQL